MAGLHGENLFNKPVFSGAIRTASRKIILFDYRQGKMYLARIGRSYKG